MTVPTYEVGKEVTSYCTKCRVERLHIIVALADEKPKRVQCKACEGVHNYRPLKRAKERDQADETTAAAAGSGKKPAKAKKPKAKTAAERKFEEKLAADQDRRDQLLAEWTAGKENLSGESARPYSMEDVYQLSEAIEHTSFGTGFVKEVIDPNKIMVLFERGLKRLAQNRP